jgi:ABC-type glycerol-3-phosphate transport system permease component
VGVLFAAFVLPLAWAVLASFTPETELFGGSRLPSQLTLEHYRALFGERAFWAPVRNSIAVAASTTLVCLALGAPCAYALARLRFPGKRPILAFVLAVSMFPQITIVSPLYLALREVGLIDTIPGLVLPYLTFAMPLTVWLLTTYFRELPAEIEQAAAVDGAGRLDVLVRIVLPLAAPGLATTAILTFLYSWNELLFALAFTVDPDRRTVPVAIALFRGQYQVPWGQILAATIVATLPVALLVLAFQRRIVRGLTGGALKG